MAETLIKKLGIKPNQKLLILNAPEGYIESLNDLPAGVEISTSGDGPFEFVQVFAYKKTDVDTYTPQAIQAIKTSGLLWFAYPKKSSKIKTDIHRDSGWEALIAAGWDEIKLIALDDMWSAMRFRPVEDIKRQKKR